MSSTLTEIGRYKTVFVSDAMAELARLTIVVDDSGLSMDKPILNSYINLMREFAVSIKIHTFFLPENLSNVTAGIFENTKVRDFVFCLRDRLSISLASDIQGLMKLIAEYAGTGEAMVDRTKCLVPDHIPHIFVDGLLGDSIEVLDILRNNTFLLVPIMCYLCFAELLTAQILAGEEVK